MRAAGSRPQTGGPAPCPFRTADAARILGVTPARVRVLVRAGACRPARRGRLFAFAFQDLVLLRAAHGLLQRKVPPRRVRRALGELAQQLPPDRPLSGVRVYADGRQVVARDGRGAWQPESGQIVFSFAIDDLARRAGLGVARARPGSAQGPPPVRSDGWVWFERALALEHDGDVRGACRAYRRALAADPTVVDAQINLGRLLHEGGDPRAAIGLYHLALERAPADAVAHYNLGLALEDVGRWADAVAHYRRAIQSDAAFADAHFNLSRLLERLGERAQALRHLRLYQRLTSHSQ